MFAGRPARRRRQGCGAVVLTLAAALFTAAPAQALMVEGAVADAISGSSGTPAGTVLSVYVEASAGTPVPHAAQFAVGEGLQLGAAGPGCPEDTVRTQPVACPQGSEIGEGQLETASRSFRLRLFTLSPSSLMVRIEASPVPFYVDATTISLDASQRVLSLALPPSVRGDQLRSLRLRLGGDDPDGDWVRSTLCPNGAWSLTGSLLNDQGVYDTGTSTIGCRPPRRAQLGKITPLFSLSRSRRADGSLTPLRLDAATLPAGLPSDAVVHITCRSGCRGSWRRRASASGSTRVRIRPGIRLNTSRLRLQVTVASRQVRGTYLVIAFTRNAAGRVTGWKGVGRGCVKLGSRPVRMSCPR